jgi:REP element-mobilizing transposase RayT
MVIASHCIFTAYGFWLPNDPRGSWSDFVRSGHLLKFGKATKIEDTRSVAGRPHDRHLREAAKGQLQRPPVQFTGIQARAIARGFSLAFNECDYRIYACSILPEHVHIVVERHDRPVERIVAHLKTRATQQLVKEGLHPFSQLMEDGRFPSVWGARSWKVFLNSAQDVRRAIQYVENNPIKHGLKKQNWSFVRGFQDPASPRAAQVRPLNAELV